ncbi:MAG: AMP-binding protein [Candidatus Dormiibacterota bacterium]
MKTAGMIGQLRSRDLVAVTLEPGRAWLPILRAARETGFAVLPLDTRLAGRERERLLGRAKPTVLLGADGLRRVDGVPVEAGITLVIATSGTSGRPCLAELPHSAVAAAIRASSSVIGADSRRRWIAALPLAHIGGMLVVFRHLILGAPITFRSRLTPSAIAGVPDARFTSIVPTQLVRLLDGGADLRHFRAILVGGSGMDAALARAAAAAGAPVVQTYGMTETCGGVVYAGRPLAGVEVRASTDGELLVRGPTLMRGYRLDPEATAAVFDADGWLHTGDGGDVRSDGIVHVRGKLADVIVSGGEKIWPAEVEAALSQHPEVAAVMVSASPDGEWGQRVVARVVPRRRGAPPSLESLNAHAGESIARHKLPRELIIVDDLDRNALGKLRRR